MIVPDQVLFGLIDGVIKGPFNNLPDTYAIVSLKKAIKIVKYNKFLSSQKILKKLIIKIRIQIRKRRFE